MAGFIPAPPNPAADMAAAIFLKGLGGFGRGLREQDVKSDTQGLLDYLRNQQQAQQYGGLAVGSMAGGPMGGFFGNAVAPDQSSAVTPPTMKTKEGMGMLLNWQLGRMLTPLQQAQLGETTARTGLLKAQTFDTLNPSARPAAQTPRRLQEGNEYGLPAGSVIQFDANNDMKILWQPPDATVNQTEHERAVELLGDTERFSKLTPDQRRAIRYKAGLESRPTTRDDTQMELGRWLGIYRNAKYDPVWGQGIPELGGVADVAETKIGQLTAQLRNGAEAQPLSRGESIQELRGLKVGGKLVTDRVPLATLVTKYPALSLQLATLREAELDEVLSAIESGMPESDILGFFAGGKTNAGR